MLETLRCILKGEFVTLPDHVAALVQVDKAATDAANAFHKKDVENLKHLADSLQAQVDDLQDINKTLSYNINVTEGERDAARRKIAESLKVLQS